ELGIVVRDVEAVTPFYRDGLGLEHIGDVETKLALNRRLAWGEDVLTLLQLFEPPTIAHPPRGTAGSATGFRYVVLRQDDGDLEEILARCEAAGGKAYKPIMEFETSR